MDSIENVETEKKPVKRRAKRRLVPRVAVVKPPTAGSFAGMTVTDCCDGCNVDGCVISGKAYCAHPRKGGLHPAQMSEPAALKRLQEAKRILGKQMLELRDA